MNFSGCKGRMLACKMPSPVALEDIAKSRCFLVGLVTGANGRMTMETQVTRRWQETIGRITMETTVKAGRQDQAATDAVEDWDQSHLPELKEPRSSRRISQEASGVMTRQRKPRSSIARKLLIIKTTWTGKAAGALTWRLLISYLEQTRWRSSRRF